MYFTPRQQYAGDHPDQLFTGTSAGKVLDMSFKGSGWGMESGSGELTWGDAFVVISEQGIIDANGRQLTSAVGASYGPSTGAQIPLAPVTELLFHARRGPRLGLGLGLGPRNRRKTHTRRAQTNVA